MTFEQSLRQYIELHPEAGNGGFRAALIDMDGTLYDSMPHHAAAWLKMMAEENCPIEERDIYLNEGMTGVATVDLLFRRHFGHGVTADYARELYARKASYFATMPPVEVIAGAQSMIESFLAHGLTTVLVTGSSQSTTLGRLDSDFPGAFPENRRVTANNVGKGKPDPEPYLRAMEMAGVDAGQSIVVDNAPLGVMSGARSGAFTIGITTGPVPEKALYDAGANFVFDSMEAFLVSIDRLYSL